MSTITLPRPLAVPRRPERPAPLPAASERVRRSAPLRNALPVISIGAILAVQGAQCWRLMHSNSAFLDEATYLAGGHTILDGTSQHYATYFSGAPVIYPVIAAFLDGLGGLHLARAFSLVLMLGATLLCWSTARRLFGEVAAFAAALFFSTTQGTIYLGSFATYDAMSLFFVALAAWIAVTTARRSETSVLPYLAAPALAIANATKYASLVYDPVVLALYWCAVSSIHGRRAAWRGSARLGALTTMLLTALLALAGPAYLTGISSTTTNRAAGHTQTSVVLHDAQRWIGALVLLAVAGAGITTVRALLKKETGTRSLLVWLCVGAALLAPLNQARIHTTTSLSKHVNFGAWFGAIAAGVLVAYLVRGRFWWRIPALAAVVVLTVPLATAGWNQAWHQFHIWSDSKPLVAKLRPLMASPDSKALVDDADVPRYYLRGETTANQWVSTFYLSYTDPETHQRLVGPDAFADAVNHGYFSVIALNFGVQKQVDSAVAKAIHDSKKYHWVGDVASSDVFGSSSFTVWTRVAQPTEGVPAT